MKKKNSAIIMLLLLAPIVGELLSGSTPPVEFINPIGLLFLVALCGCGALFIRELVHRWHKGWLSVILLGMAYGIFEEGIVVRSFFDPAWPDLGILAEYGRWMGVNWVWIAVLIIFHALVSITIPILLVELVFPSVRDESWLGRKGFWAVGLIFLSTLLIAPLFGLYLTLWGIIACLLAIAGLVFMASCSQGPQSEKWINREPASLTRISAASFLMMMTFLFVYIGLPELGVPVAITIMALILIPIFTAGLAYRIGVFSWGDTHKWAAVLGAMIPWILLTFIAEMDNVNRLDDTIGMSLVGIGFLVFLIVLGVFTKRRSKQGI